mmetsp:Transcript_22083/g.26056  ORF Transcript_22083/g.26056 Transcript_22083/m.26056 type:complete len:140 (-) Transcript_22083:167-586(-)
MMLKLARCALFVIPTNSFVPQMSSGLNKFFSSKAFRGPMQEFVETSLKNKLKPSFLEVINESHGQIQDESHFKAIIVTEEFHGKSLVARHRLVNSILMSESGVLPFHSLTIIAKTPDQWAIDNNVAPSPKCAGGDGRGK